jgi:hypothetical protein
MHGVSLQAAFLWESHPRNNRVPPHHRALVLAGEPVKVMWIPVLIVAVLGLEFLAEVAAVMIPKWKERRKNGVRR